MLPAAGKPAGGQRQGGSSSGSPNGDAQGTQRAQHYMILHRKAGKTVTGVMPDPGPVGADLIITPSSRDESVEQRQNIVDEGQNALLRGVGALAAIERSGDAYDRAVAAVHPHGIFDQVVLGPPLTGDAAIVGPEPVQNQLARVSLGDEITV